MKIRYAFQGFIFAPLFIGLVFLLKLTCPDSSGGVCFADNFLTPIFLPLTFLYKLFAPIAPVVAHHEPLFIIGYWMVVAFLIGLLIDISQKENS